MDYERRWNEEIRGMIYTFYGLIIPAIGLIALYEFDVLSPKIYIIGIGIILVFALLIIINNSDLAFAALWCLLILLVVSRLFSSEVCRYTHVGGERIKVCIYK